MTLSLGQLPCPDSPLRRLDPRWKLAALLVTVAAVVALRSLSAAALALGNALLLAALGRLPLRWYLRRLGAMGLVLAPFVVLLPLLHDGGSAWHVGPVRVSADGLASALLVILKALALVTLLLVVLATAPLHVTLQAAQALRVPGLLVQLVALTYRYIFVLAGELARLRLALRVRGYRNRPSLHSYRTVGHVAGTLLVRGSERAERVGQAMRSRGFDGRFRSLAEFRTTPRDVAAFALLAGAALGLLMLDKSGAGGEWRLAGFLFLPLATWFVR